jgi:hypothetical protein
MGMNNMMPTVTLNDRPNGRMQLGSPLKRLLDEAETGLLRANSLWMMMVVVVLRRLFNTFKSEVNVINSQ